MKTANFDRLLVITCFFAFIYNIFACVIFDIEFWDILSPRSIVRMWVIMSLLACLNIANINQLFVQYIEISTFAEIILDCIMLVFYCTVNELAFSQMCITLDLRLASMIMFCSVTILLLLKMRNKSSKLKFLLLLTFIAIYYIIGKVINRQLLLCFMEHIVVALIGPGLICLRLFPRRELNIIGSLE